MMFTLFIQLDTLQVRTAVKLATTQDLIRKVRLFRDTTPNFIRYCWKHSVTYRPRPTAHRPRPTAHGPPPTAHGPRPTAQRPRPTAHGP